ncbi:FAD-dependent oxidoreductase [Candidatus Woesearchaeota archaeon]|nr:FAD-dependent oxidoreductase [Candidatus Woesearchaeota archaeon]
MVLNLELPVIEVKQETFDVKSIKLALVQRIEYKPGHYMMVELDVDDPENGSARPLSIASSPTEGFLLFSTKISQTLFKQRFNSLKIWDKVKIKGPMGVFTLKEDAKEVILLGGGIGITPFRGMIKYAADKKLPMKLILVYSNKTPADIVYRDEWSLFEKQNPNFKAVHTITQPEGTSWNGRVGRIDEKMIKECCNDINNATFYICGPPGMVDGLSNLLKTMNVPASNVKIEKFAGY